MLKNALAPVLFVVDLLLLLLTTGIAVHTGSTAAWLLAISSFLLVIIIANFMRTTIDSLRLEHRDLVDTNLQLDHKLQQSLQANEQFWSNVSHNLRTPLNSILGYTELLMEEPAIRRQTSLTTDLDRVKAAGDEMLQLVNDLLSMSTSMTSSKTRAPFVEHTDIDQLIKDIEVIVAPLAADHRNKLTINHLASPCVVMVDSRKLDRVLLLLLTNSIKAIHDGTISLTASYQSNIARLHFVIQDDGQFVNLSDWTSIFEPFSQPDASTYGSGIGLAVCKQLLIELHGTIGFQNMDHGGARFDISLPAPSATPESEGTASQNRSIHHLPPSVLVIDEQVDSAELIGRYLTRLGCTVTVATDGFIGKEMAAEIMPNFVIIDVEMQTTDGWAILENIRLDYPTREITAIVCSSMEDPGRAAKLGVEECLTKPVSEAALSNVLQKLEPFAARDSKSSTGTLHAVASSSPQRP